MQGMSNYYWALEAAKWGADFLALAVKEGKMLLHIGDISKDHGQANLSCLDSTS